MNQGTNLGSQIGRWIVLAAVVALLGALLLTTRPVGAQSTGDCEKIGGELQCSYVEHSAGHVYDFHAATAGAEIAWTLVTTGAGATSHPDFGDFRIDQESGVLTFKSPPNYESPMGGGTENDSNTYMVMLKVEVDTDAGRTTTEQGVTANVTNKEEDGGVTLNNLQPQVRELITATLGDPDGSVVESTWQWSSSSSRSSGYTPIAGATAATYRPAEGDTGMYLRATVTYTDGYGAEVDSAMTESLNPVRAETGADNADPAFGEDDDLSSDAKTTTREIDENTPAGTNIGPPVFATDDDLDVLTYSISDSADQAKFAINAENGQLMTKASLNFEAAAGSANNCAALNSCVVEVTVKDPLGNRADDPALDTITVTIAVNDLNEAPTASGPVLLIRHPELDESDPPEATTVLDTDPAQTEVQEADFTAKDQESTEADDSCTDDSGGSTCSWELEGPDAGSFTIGDGTGNTTFGRLAFRNAPNLEKPGDANKDNVYQVTVVARDSQLATGSRDVTVRVTNEEEPGSVSLSHIQPEVATSLTASLTDVDGGITGLKWQWMRSTAGDADSPTTCDATAADTDYGKITGKTSSTYRPAPADVGKCLRVTATYDDTVTNKDDADTTDIDESEPTVVRATSENPVRVAVSPNDKPYFEADGTAPPPLARVTAYTRYIEENLDAGASVVLNENGTSVVPDNDNVKATDTEESTADPITPDDEDSLQYELGGPSKDYFRLAPAGLTADPQTVTIETTKMLDREDEDRHTVKVKATDPSGGTATVTVTINVVNIDEAPKIDDAGPMHVEYMENGTAAVANYMAKDPEGTAITWTVLGNGGTATAFDAEDLKVTAKGGPRTMLAFKSAPNYESPEGGALADGTGKGNIYTVTLRAAVNNAANPASPTATEMDTVTIMVGVTDVPEAPVFSDDSNTLTVDEHVKADTDVHRNVGSKVAAKDSDGDIHLTYSLSGTDEGSFTIVPATGQIKTTRKLDYETKNSFSVVVTATDPTDRSDTINITIEVDDVAEAPDIVPDGVSVSGETDVDYNENDTAAVGTYEAEGPEAASARWTLDGPDASHFMLDGTAGMSTMLKFKSAPDFEMPRGRPMSDTNTNDYMVTVKAEADGDMAMVEVTITVDNVEELGMLSGDGSFSYAEGGTDAVGTYTLTAIEDGPTVTWSLDGTDMSDFMLEGTGMSRTLNFKNAPDYEMPADADTNNTYMVTVKAEADGEMAMQAVNVMVTNVVELGMLSGDGSFSYAEGGTDAVGTYTLTAIEDGPTVTWSLDGTDMSDFMLEGTGMSRTLNFKNAPDYEMPADADTNNTYMVTVKAEAGGEMAMQAVNVMVTNVVELGMLSGDGSFSYAEGGTDAVGTYTLTAIEDGPMVTWSLDGTDMSDFMLEGTGMSRTLTFNTSPDYEMPADADGDNEYMVTVKAEAGGEMAMQAVNVMVTNVVELGMLTGMESPSHPENSMDTVATYTLTAIEDGPTVTWSLDGTDMSDFMLEGTGMSRTLTFNTSPDYEMPADADTNNTYMVTVKAEAGGEMAMQAVNVMVTNVVELGMLSGDGSFSYAEGGTDAVGTYTLTAIEDGPMVTWSLDGTDMSDFMLEGTGMSRTLTFNTSPDYEMPADADTNNTYMVTVKAEAGGEMAMQAVNVMVTNVGELGMLEGTESIFYAENGTDAVGTYTTSGPDTATWSLEGADAEDFNISSGGSLAFKTSPDFEAPADADTNNTYMVTVKAEAGGEMDTQDVTVTVTDMGELGMLEGTESIFYAENGTDAVGTYTTSGPDTATWSLEGADAEDFNISSGGSLAFKTSPDFEAPADADTNNTYMVTVKAEAGGEMDTQDVTVTVTDVGELGMLEGMESISYAENVTMTVATYTVSGGDGSTIDWSLDGADASQFMLDGTDNMSRMLKFKSAPDYEMPRGQAISDTNTNTYMVTVKASAGDVMEMVEVTIEVTDVDDGAVTPVDSVGRYDTNGTEGIQIDELFDAIDDYFAGGIITIDQLFQIIDAYFLG